MRFPYLVRTEAENTVFRVPAINLVFCGISFLLFVCDVDFMVHKLMVTFHSASFFYNAHFTRVTVVWQVALVCNR